MLYGLQKSDPDIRDQGENLLLQYCELDTLGMVMIYRHWKEKLK